MLRFLPLLFALLALGACSRTSTPPAADVEDAAEVLYTCGMHPQVIEDHPGTCPICGMDLTPMTSTPSASNELVIRPGVLLQAGVETAPVERTTVFRHLRTLGEVEVGEDELAVVNLRYSGWVERLLVDRTGDEVRQGQVLFEIYSPELVAAEDEYLLALHSQGADAALTHSARRKLELWNIAAQDIDAIAKSGEASRTMPIRAPQRGYVLHKAVVEGARVVAGSDLYRIGNLQRIWVKAEVYEQDAAWIEEGQPAHLELTNLGGQVIEGRVAYLYPTLNERSRTLTIRLEFANPGVRLKPGMFAMVQVQYRRMDDVVAVPSSAILHSGLRELVFVAKGHGAFEPREITTGLVGDRRLTEVRSGLSAGEEVVVSGQFLLDSESQLQAGLQKLRAGVVDAPAAKDTVWSCPMHPDVVDDHAGRCPQCGMDLEERPGTQAELASLKAGPAAPGQYTCPMHPEVVRDGPGRCPECGMFLEQVPEPDAEPHAHGEVSP